MKGIRITFLEVVKILSFVGVLIVLIIKKFEINILLSLIHI